MAKLLTICSLAVMVCLLTHVALAQTSGGTGASSEAQSARIAKLEQAVADAKSSGDNAWMLMSSALVLMMTGPGLALFYGGLVRKKNVLATMMQSFAHDGHRHGAVGPGRVQPGIRFGQQLYRRACTTSSCAGWERSPTPTMPPPFRCRLS